jgi:hypothetical protein
MRESGILNFNEMKIHLSIIVVPLLMFLFYFIGWIAYEPWYNDTISFVRRISGERFYFVGRPQPSYAAFKKFAWFFAVIPLLVWFIHMYTWQKSLNKLLRTVIFFFIAFSITWFILCCFQYSNVFATKEFIKGADEFVRLIRFDLLYWLAILSAAITTAFINIVLAKIDHRKKRATHS